MNASVGRIGKSTLLVVLVLVAAPCAMAFVPWGGWDSFGVLRYATWRFGEFDTDNNGEIESDEGLPIYLEGGSSGFTPDELSIVKDAFQVWQDVPTSYARVRYAGTFDDPIQVLEDSLLSVSMQVTDVPEGSESEVADPDDVLVPEATFPVLGVTVVLFAIDETVVEVDGEGYLVPAGTILDSDIIIDAASHRTAEGAVEPLVDLKSTLVHEIGHMFGLAHSPVSNLNALDEQAAGAETLLLEKEAFWFTNPQGETGYIGVTPTMFPIAFFTETSAGYRYDGGADLAPDDISGISFLYPRGSMSNFFDIEQEVRTRTRRASGLPSAVVMGSHVVAWADIDNSPDTPRVPLFSTLSGLYEPQKDVKLAGRFRLKGLWKQFEVPGMDNTRFNPTYTLSSSPLNESGFTYQAPEGLTPFSIDGLQGELGFSETQRTESDYSTSFLSEVFHETENLTGVTNSNSGTPLVWSFEKDTVVSSVSGDTLPTILPDNEPMFGDPNDICPMNVISGGGTEVAASLGGGMRGMRGFRDAVLLDSAVGAAVVELYYSAAPFVARFLVRHPVAQMTSQRVMSALMWSVKHWMGVLSMCGVLLCGWGLRRFRRRRAVVFGVMLLVGVLGAVSAQASQVYLTTPEMVQKASEVVAGKVVAAESRWKGRHIYTDVVVEVQEEAKGSLNKGSSVSVSVMGGRIGALVMRTSAYPTFKKDEEVVLYLQPGEEGGYSLYGGLQGKLKVETDSDSKAQYVCADTPANVPTLLSDAKVLNEAEDKDETAEKTSAMDMKRVPLKDYMSYLRSLAQAQEAAKAR